MISNSCFSIGLESIKYNLILELVKRCDTLSDLKFYVDCHEDCTDSYPDEVTSIISEVLEEIKEMDEDDFRSTREECGNDVSDMEESDKDIKDSSNKGKELKREFDEPNPCADLINKRLDDYGDEVVDAKDLPYDLLGDMAIQYNGSKAEILVHADEYALIASEYDNVVKEALKETFRMVRMLSEEQIQKIKEMAES